MVEFKVKLRSFGTSLVVTIPKEIIDDLKLKKDDQMCIDVKDKSTITVRRCN